MLVTPRQYQKSQLPDKGFRDDIPSQYHALTGWWYNAADYQHATEMLLVHQSGSVRVGEVVRYTLTYTPSLDRILPPPTHLHVKIKNTSAIPLRAAYLHGPYTLYVACYPATFDPNHKHERVLEEGAPDFEPNLKAGGNWTTKLKIPEEVREAAGGPRSRASLETSRPRSFTWIIEVASQVLFSRTASVHYEVLVGRDERSLDLGFPAIAGSTHGGAGKLDDHQKSSKHNVAQAKGVYSKAVHLLVEDTECLWNSPELPSWDNAKDGPQNSNQTSPAGPIEEEMGQQKNSDRGRKQKRKRIHLVILTHGLHSNIGADMLYMKESIDNSAREAREAAMKDKARRREERRKARVNERVASPKGSRSMPELPGASASREDDVDDEEDSDDEEHVVVRGFSGNAVRTERGIQYLGKRLAKYVLSITYPDQPYLPTKSSISKSITRSLTGSKNNIPGQPSHKGSSIHRDDEHAHGDLPYQITSISFIAHSLGGLVQTYAIAYINKHSPGFFDLIKPINFVACATPFLGLSNENPIYVKFALDFGLVGRTGQDLGLTWRAPAVVRNGWSAMISGLGKDNQKAADGQAADPSSKPLLRILPTGPAHSALLKFRNRTVYSNVVNDGIVPLRTSCLLFLDWKGLERVEKARREMGLVGTMAGWGWAELTGQNASSPRTKGFWSDIFSDNEDSDSSTSRKHGHDVPQPAEEATTEDNIKNSETISKSKDQSINKNQANDEGHDRKKANDASSGQSSSAWAGLLSIFKQNDSKSQSHQSPKSTKIYQRGQVKLSQEPGSSENASSSDVGTQSSGRAGLVRGPSLYGDDPTSSGVQAPPKTTFFEAAGDLLNPPLPPKEFLIDPAARPRTIFHDRVYHPEDIPPPPLKKQRIPKSPTGSMHSSDHSIDGSDGKSPSLDGPVGSMKVEEKIARAYHHELSWRKVLVRLEPDAHNNIIVRRMFANAYGWPVVQHICDTHFAYTEAARTEDKYESNEERARTGEVIGSEGELVKGQHDPPKSDHEPHLRTNSADTEFFRKPKPFKMERPRPRSESEARELLDEVSDLRSPSVTTLSPGYTNTRRTASLLSRNDSGRWSDRYFEGSDDDDSDSEIPAPPRLNLKTDESPLPSPTVADVLSSSPTKEQDLHLPTQPPTVASSSGNDATQKPSEAPALDRAALALSSLGIHKNPLDSAQSSHEEGQQPHLGVAEQVAFAQAKKQA